MQFSLAAVVGVLAAVASAKPVVTNSGFDVQAGQPFTLTWVNATGPVTVELVNGASGNLKPVGSPLATGVSTGSFTWTPPSNLPTDKYAFRVTDSDAPNYTLQFDFKGSASASSSSSSSTVASTSSASSTSTVVSTTSSAATTSSASTTSSAAVTSSAANTTTVSTVTKASSSASHSASASSAPVNTNGGERFSSSLALVLGAAVALVAFN